MEKTSSARPKKAPGARYFLIANALYLIVVQGLSLTIQPVGRDFAAFAGTHEAPGSGMLQILYQALGTQVALYHTLNLALLYGCMVCVFFLTRMLVQGPWWLSSLSAALLMANPIKSEAVYYTSGILDLAPAFLTLVVLTAYVHHGRTGSKVAYISALVIWAFSALVFPQTWGLALVLFLVEVFRLANDNRRIGIVLPFMLPLVPAFLLLNPPHGWLPHSFLDWLTPLYLILFPVGFLPETEVLFLEQAHWWWLAALFMGGLAGWICWGARSKALLFGLVAAVAFRLFPHQPFDLVHMAGGGQMIVPTALLTIALSALCWRMVQHKKWVRPVVFVTTMLCVLFFALQLRELFAWRHAAQQTLAFQARARLTHEAAPERALAIMPNFSYHRTAPLQLHQAIAHDGPFSVAYPAAPLFTLRYFPPGKLFAEVLEHTPRSVQVRMTGQERTSALPRDFKDTLWPEATVQIQEVDQGFTISLVAKETAEDFPTVAIPYRNGGQFP